MADTYTATARMLPQQRKQSAVMAPLRQHSGAIGAPPWSTRRKTDIRSIDGIPGDRIVVPEDFTRTHWTKDPKNWTQIFCQFGLRAAALKVIQQ